MTWVWFSSCLAGAVVLLWARCWPSCPSGAGTVWCSLRRAWCWLVRECWCRWPRTTAWVDRGGGGLCERPGRLLELTGYGSPGGRFCDRVAVPDTERVVQRSQPTPSCLPSKPCGSAASTSKRRAEMSLQSRSVGPGLGCPLVCVSGRGGCHLLSSGGSRPGTNPLRRSYENNPDNAPPDRSPTLFSRVNAWWIRYVRASMRIFISYRREEQPVAIAAFGLAQICKQAGCEVFMDVAIPPLADWKQVLRDAVSGSTVMLVAVGQKWLDLLTQREEDGTPDWVRFEVVSALDHGIPVGPVLFGDDTPFRAERLPADVRFLGDRQETRIATSSVYEFDRDCNILATALLKHYGSLSEVDEARQSMITSNERRLVNTVWTFPGTETNVIFRPDHQVDFSNTDSSGYWELQGDRLQFDCNRFTMYELTWHSKKMMSGHWYRLNDSADKGTSSLRFVGQA